MRIIGITAFIDWNSQLLLSGINAEKDPERAAAAALTVTARRIAKCLTEKDPTARFRVSMRLYYGWHKGYEPTQGRKAAQVLIGKTDFATLSTKPNVIFSPLVTFGDKLTNALDRRLHQRLSIHLPNTVRERSHNDLEEKMVDTALAADVVTTAHRDEGDWIMVVTEDDDLIPPIFVAESILARSDSKVVLLRKRHQAGMMNLDDLLSVG
jgi:hypothetical protein